VTLPDVTLGSGDLLLIHHDAGIDDLDLADGVGHFFTGDATLVFEAEDQVALYDSLGQAPENLIDLVAWDNDTTRSSDFDADTDDGQSAGLWPAGAAVAVAGLAPSQSLGLSGDSIRTGSPGDWEISGGRDAADPTPGRLNIGGVVLNEILSNPISGMAQGLELYNSGSGDVNLTGWLVSDEDEEGGGEGLSYLIPQVNGADLVLLPTGRLWISLETGVDDADRLHAPQPMTNPLDLTADQVAVYIRNDRDVDRIVDFISWDGSSIHGLDWLADDDLAEAAAIWNGQVSDDYVDVYSLSLGYSILRITDGLDSDQSLDWMESAGMMVGDRDADGDGLVATRDNCPDLANADQADIDGDGLGDVCDPDRDGDGVVDSSDCSIADPDLWSLPATPGGLLFSTSSSFGVAPEPLAQAYDVYRGAVPAGGNFEYSHPCLVGWEPGPDFVDSGTPAAGALFYYLVSAVNGCGSSDVGTDSAGTPRPLPQTCP
jgi:hypothetical protein